MILVFSLFWDTFQLPIFYPQEIFSMTSFKDNPLAQIKNPFTFTVFLLTNGQQKFNNQKEKHYFFFHKKENIFSNIYYV